jgi:uncharacterized protein
MRIFADTSALLKLYLDEAGSDAVFSALAAASELAVSSIVVVEAHSALVRRCNAGEIAAEDYEPIREYLLEDLGNAWRVEVDDVLLTNAISAVERHNLRALDAIQLASALRCRPALFLSADSRLAEAARREGLEVLIPE